MTAASGLRMYSKAQAQESQQMLIERHGPLVKRIAYHLLARLPANVQVEDLMQAGMIGLLEAAKKYDASKGASFETMPVFAFAVPCWMRCARGIGRLVRCIATAAWSAKQFVPLKPDWVETLKIKRLRPNLN